MTQEEHKEMADLAYDRAEYWSRLAQFAKKQEADNKLLSEFHYKEFLDGFDPVPVVAQ